MEDKIKYLKYIETINNYLNNQNYYAHAIDRIHNNYVLTFNGIKITKKSTIEELENILMQIDSFLVFKESWKYKEISESKSLLEAYEFAKSLNCETQFIYFEHLPKQDTYSYDELVNDVYLNKIDTSGDWRVIWYDDLKSSIKAST